MKKTGDLFKELGFRADACPHAQRAFFKHLIQAARDLTPKNPESIPKQREQTEKSGEQLSFDPHVLKAGND